jgi:RNA polymerase sigma-70 factor (ECF subfamily)
VSNDPATDRSNLHDLQKGDTSALNRLIARWQRPLLSFAFRYVQNSSDAQDLVAETFVRLHQRRSQLRQDTNLSAWLFTTLTNLCHNHHRWKRRHPTVAFGPGESGDSAASAMNPADPESSPDASLVSVLLHHYEHLSYREIAAITRCSERGVETRLYRARAQLRSQLSRYFQESPSLGLGQC